MTYSKTRMYALWLTALLCLARAGIAAQPMPLDAAPDPLPTLLLNTPVEHYGSLELSGLSPAQWETFSALHVALLDDENAETRINAMRNIIHFANHYGDRVDFRKANRKLYAIYRFERDGAARIYALTALHAIGDEAIMRQLARDARWERSDRIRRHIHAVVNDYFTNTNG